MKIHENPWKSSFFTKLHVFWWNAWHCAHLPITRRRLRHELKVPEVSGSRFRTGRHALDAPEAFKTDSATFMFHEKIKIFKKSWKSLKIHWFWPMYLIQGSWSLLARQERNDPEKWRDRSRGPVGVPESPITLGMVIVMFIQVFMTIGGLQIDFSILD